MHDLIIAISFIAMVLAPCVVASFSGEDMEEEATA
jgi:hypothetical protein